MAEQLLNMTGLTYFKQKLDAEYLKDADIAIKSVKVNGSALTPDAQKAVNLKVPVITQIVEPNSNDVIGINFRNDTANDQCGADLGLGDNTLTANLYDSTGTNVKSYSLATTNYVDANGGKIDVINVNGTAQNIDNKEVDLQIVSTTGAEDAQGKQALFKVVGEGGVYSVEFEKDENGLSYKMKHDTVATVLTDKAYVDSTFRTETQVQTAIENALAGVTEVRFEVVSTLPATGENGVFYLVPNAGTTGNEYNEHIWVNKGTTENPNYVFENLGPRSLDLSNYVQQSDIEIITTAQIDALFVA